MILKFDDQIIADNWYNISIIPEKLSIISINKLRTMQKTYNFAFT